MTTEKHNDGADRPATGDRLDALLRAWHDENRGAAEASRDEILRSIERDELLGEPDRGPFEPARPRGVLARIGGMRMLASAALLVLAVTLVALFTRGTERAAFADGGVVQVAEGGALDALDADGNTLGPCPLQRTDVKVEISGRFVRTVVEQTYANPYPRTIEAVYTFPLSNRAAVDRMTMVVRGPAGEKTVEGEVRERAVTRAIYEEARESGYVASLLEQERPNIFTQSVANIEPGATVKVRIATIELAQRRNGVSEFVFPMVVGPRYIPGAPKSMPTLPEGWQVREGVVLRAPAAVELSAAGALSAARLLALLESAVPVRAAANEHIDRMLSAGEGVSFTAKYGNGSAERGVYFPAAGLGEINGRFFFAPLAKDQGTGFAGDTGSVPDASRITPMPVKPSERAGHDIGIAVSIDTGGTAVTDVSSELHEISVESKSASTRTIALDDRKTIPNRDFILRWKTSEDAIEPSFFAHVAQGAGTQADGGYFMIAIEPPARVAPAEVRPRELVFVLDTSGSMNGFPIEKSKALAQKAIDAMRPNDTCNFITFAGATRVLWNEPRAATEENRRIASEFVANAQSGGGTEMMTAINAALVQEGRSGMSPARLLDLPADGRAVRVAIEAGTITQGKDGWTIDAGAGRAVAVDMLVALPANPRRLAVIADGSWETRLGNRVLVVRSARFEDADARTRFVFFLTDGYIGNDQGVVAAVRENARASRVFSFGIGNSVNRFLLEELARAGRGTCEVVTLAESADAAIERLVRRIESPVLTDIALDVPASLGVRELLPAGENLPDLYDQEPIVLIGRFDRAASGVITIRGRTGAGAWEKAIPVALPATEARHDVVKTLWARAKVDELLLPRLAQVESQTLDGAVKRAVIALGESYSIATPYTSFVAVERSRTVVGGKPMLVSVPVELPDGTTWDGFFGEGVQPAQLVDSELGKPLPAGKTRRTLEEELRRHVERREIDPLGFGAPSNMPRMDIGAGTGGVTGGVSAAPEAAAMPSPSSSPPVAASVAPPLGGGFGAAKRESAESTRDAGAASVPVAPPGGLPPVATTRGPAGGRGPARPAAAPADRSGGEPVMRSAVSPETRSNSSAGFRGGGGGGGGKIAPDARGESERGQAAQGELLEANEAMGLESADSKTEGIDAAKAEEPAIDRDRLIRVLERRLALVALLANADTEAAAELAAAFALPVRGGELEVVILLAALDDAARKELKEIGVSIDGEITERGAVLGRVKPAGLVALAKAKCARRVEPLRATPAG
ncbi:MAG: VIT and vWA domain-containing protein [Planctomycetota bacterium]